MVGGSPGTDDMNGRLADGFVVTASQRLAVDCDYLVHCGDPIQQALLELGRLDSGENGIEAIVRRNAGAQVENLFEKSFFLDLANSAIATKSSAPQITAQTLITTKSISGYVPSRRRGSVRSAKCSMMDVD